MSDALQEPISVFCDEVGLPMPAPNPSGAYVISVDGQEIRVSSRKNGKIVLLGVIGRANEIAERREESRQALLTSCLNLQAVRFGKLGTPEVLTFEPESGELVLWLSFEGPGVPIPAFLQGTESLLNELEFWKNWLAVS
ncbi:MAG: type III secretion system chaperone [Verrucomicrobiota bacterium]|jgi:hypothetical protein|nr:type III secretion system chaperone [Verrucomicrobiota bacterium]